MKSILPIGLYFMCFRKDVNPLTVVRFSVKILNLSLIISLQFWVHIEKRFSLTNIWFFLGMTFTIVYSRNYELNFIITVS